MGNAKIERQYMGKMTPFRLAAPFQPMGDQPEAVKSLTDGLRDGHWAQVCWVLRVREKLSRWQK